MNFRKVLQQDFDECDHLFQVCLENLLVRENILEAGLLESEMVRLHEAMISSCGHPNQFFYVAQKNNEIAGTIALMPPGPMIASEVAVHPGGMEIACVYVHPKYQRQGVGKFLFEQVLRELNRLKHKCFYLDAGFSSSQRYWEKILGEPSYILKNYWGLDKHHLIWHKGL